MPIKFCFPTGVKEDSSCSACLQALYCQYILFFIFGHSSKLRVASHGDLVCISLIANDVEHLFVCFVAICISSVKCHFVSLAHFLIRSLVFVSVLF